MVFNLKFEEMNYVRFRRINSREMKTAAQFKKIKCGNALGNREIKHAINIAATNNECGATYKFTQDFLTAHTPAGLLLPSRKSHKP